MRIKDAKMTTAPIEDTLLGRFSMTLIVIEMAGMDGDVTALQGIITDLKNRVGKVAGGSMTVTVTVLGGTSIVLMGMYRNAGIAYDEACAILAEHNVDISDAPQLSDPLYGDDRYQPATRGELPQRVRTNVAAATEPVPTE